MKRLKLTKWIKTKPATKAAWLAGVVGFLALIVNSFIVYQNSQMIATTRDAVLLSMDPALEVQFRIDSAFVINTSSTIITDVRIHPIAYKIQESPFKVLDRNKPSDYYLLAETLQANERIPIPLNHLIHSRPYEPSSNNPNIIRVAVITFRRQVDGKKFAVIEVFYAVLIEGDLSLFAILSGKNSATGGPTDYYIQILEEIEKTEKLFFKAGSFQ